MVLKATKSLSVDEMAAILGKDPDCTCTDSIEADCPLDGEEAVAVEAATSFDLCIKCQVSKPVGAECPGWPDSPPCT